MFGRDPSNGWKNFLKLFHNEEKKELTNVQEVREEFTIFDLNEEGMISEQQLKLVRRILDRGFKEISTVLEAKDIEFRSSPERQNNFIIDLSSQLKANHFDYLSFIHSI